MTCHYCGPLCLKQQASVVVVVLTIWFEIFAVFAFDGAAILFFFRAGWQSRWDNCVLMFGFVFVPGDGG